VGLVLGFDSLLEKRVWIRVGEYLIPLQFWYRRAIHPKRIAALELNQKVSVAPSDLVEVVGLCDEPWNGTGDKV
jgi:hypothetical protein